MIPTTPQGAFQFIRSGNYTGQEADNSTTVAADLAPGAVLQSVAGSTRGNYADGYSFCRPTEGYVGPFAVVLEDWPVSERNLVNALSDTSAPTLRDGGNIPVLVGGYGKALVKANCTKGVTLLTPVDDQFYLGPAIPNGLVHRVVADSTAITNTASESAYDNCSYTIAANSLAVGDVFRIRASGVVTTNSTDTAVIKMYLGSTAILVTATIDTASGDVFVLDCTVVIRTIGTSGTFVTFGTSYIGTPSAAASAADVPGGDETGSTSINTTTSNAITVKVTFNAASTGSTATCEAFTVEKVSASTLGLRGPFAVAWETVDNSAAAALTKVYILHPPH